MLDPLIYPPARLKWLHHLYSALVWMVNLKVPKYFLIRACMKFRRIDRLELYFKNRIVEGFIVGGIYIARRYEDHILQLFAKCLWLAVELFILNVVLYAPFRLWYGPKEDSSWKDYNPSYLQLLLGLLYYWKHDLRPKLRRGLSLMSSQIVRKNSKTHYWKSLILFAF